MVQPVLNKHAEGRREWVNTTFHLPEHSPKERTGRIYGPKFVTWHSWELPGTTSAGQDSGVRTLALAHPSHAPGPRTGQDCPSAAGVGTWQVTLVDDAPAIQASNLGCGRYGGNVGKAVGSDFRACRPPRTLARILLNPEECMFPHFLFLSLQDIFERWQMVGSPSENAV